MKSSIYAVTGGMMTAMERLNITANNLANVHTNGYKADIPFEQTIKFLTEGPFPGKDQPVLSGTTNNMAQGMITHTNRKLDLALEGPGFFAIQGANNKEVYTRNGAFNLNSKKELITMDGSFVLDKFDKKITIAGEKMQITPSGDIIVDDNYYTSLKVIQAPDRNDIEKQGNTNFVFKDPNKKPTLLAIPQMSVGALEKANINMLDGITELVSGQRTFEMQKSAADLLFNIMKKVITEIPKPI